jgi:transcriptional regulator with XRE-family HTH domain
MENPNYAQILSERILSLRKEKGLTQEALAGRLGVSFQAVSKWENEQSCPDIALLPVLADIFEIPVDSLFGRQASEPPPPEEELADDKHTARRESKWGDNPVFSSIRDVPWPDDQTLRGVVYWGRKLLSHEKMPRKRFSFNANKPEYTWLLRYSPLNVVAECSLEVEGNIQGGATAGSYIHCNDIGGGATAGSHIHCNDIGGGATGGSHINCNNVGGNAQAGNEIKCGDVGGNVEATKVTMKK